MNLLETFSTTWWGSPPPHLGTKASQKIAKKYRKKLVKNSQKIRRAREADLDVFLTAGIKKISLKKIIIIIKKTQHVHAVHGTVKEHSTEH